LPENREVNCHYDFQKHHPDFFTSGTNSRNEVLSAANGWHAWVFTSKILGL